MRIGKSLSFALLITSMAAGAARAEFLDWSVPLPTLAGGATSYSMTLQGNLLSSLNLSATQNDSTLNPFQYVNQNIVMSGTTSVGATLNGSGNTVVTFTGSNPVLSSYSFGDGNGLPNVGINGSLGSPIAGGGPAVNVVSQDWSNGSNTTQLPTVSAKNPGTLGPTVNYITFFAQVTSNGTTADQWFEVPYTAGTSPKLTLTNYTGSNETLSNVGFMLSPTLIPLDNLNFGNDPPPGALGSTFTPLPSFDGQSLSGGDGMGGAGGSLTEQLPEPSSVILLAVGFLSVAACCVRRRPAPCVVRANR
jgi:hypothetical protein